MCVCVCVAVYVCLRLCICARVYGCDTIKSFSSIWFGYFAIKEVFCGLFLQIGLFNTSVTLRRITRTVFYNYAHMLPVLVFPGISGFCFRLSCTAIFYYTGCVIFFCSCLYFTISRFTITIIINFLFCKELAVHLTLLPCKGEQPNFRCLPYFWLVKILVVICRFYRSEWYFGGLYIQSSLRPVP